MERLQGTLRPSGGYAAARLLEALVEALLALELLERGYTRNAAGKAFQAWRALIASLLALERERLERQAIPRAPTARLKPLSQLLEEHGVPGLSEATSLALHLHSYQYHGPDPAGEASPYPEPGSAASDTLILIDRLLRIAGEHAVPRLREAGAWDEAHERLLALLRQRLRGGGAGEA